MVNEILTAAALPGRCSRFVAPPPGSYVTWSDDIETDGPDGMPPRIFRHNVTLELYAPKPDPVAEAALEDAMTVRGLHWSKQERYWIASEQMYQTLYEFFYIEKRRT